MDAISVKELVLRIKHLLEGEFATVSVVGEVTGLTKSSSGHFYFSLRDVDSSLSCALFKMDAYRNPLIQKCRDGDKIICIGRIGVYQVRGTFQLIVTRLMIAGKGDLKAQFELLKRNLAQEGLFDLDVKKKIPAYARNVALITSLQGAAISDFINIFKRRSIWMDLILVGALVQGEEAPNSLRQALKLILKYNLQAENKVEVVVLARGGGSIEDLWAFNDEGLARDIYHYPLPVISAVGHQVDFSICDFVADLRAETPSAAAEILTDAQTRIKDRMKNSLMKFQSLMDQIQLKASERLSQVNPHHLFGILWEQMAHIKERLESCRKITNIEEISGYLEKTQQLDECGERLNYMMESSLEKSLTRLDKFEGMLRMLDPKNVLQRGYTFTTSEQGEIVYKQEMFDRLESGSLLNIVFYDGKGIVRK